MGRRACGVLALAAALWVAACSGGEGQRTPSATATVEPTAATTAMPTAIQDGDRVVLEWRREGGIAGFCDGMRVTANHRASLGTCRDPSAEVKSQFVPVDWIGQIEAWRDRVTSFELTGANPPGTADGMTVTLRFDGRGRRAASEAEQQEIANFAAELFNALRLQQPRVDAR